ncbi:MAG: helix-turn-helix domain-containing protein [Paracoccaceae bacterium]|nr:helix-turn-helix domain-containing protein [Paracoccaceae bacterium]
MKQIAVQIYTKFNLKNPTVIKSNIATAVLMETIVRSAYGPQASGDIQPLQWSILRYIRSNPRSHCTMSLIRKSLGKTHAPVVRAIQTLVNRGFVAQMENPRDGRSKMLLLTEAGIESLRNDPLLKIVECLDALPQNELRNLKKSITKMAHVLVSDAG